MYPIYIVSKGRAAVAQTTTSALAKMFIPHTIIVERKEIDVYEKNKNEYATIVALETVYEDNNEILVQILSEPDDEFYAIPKNELLAAVRGKRYEDYIAVLERALFLRWDHSYGRGSVIARNASKILARKAGTKAFWNFDDNVVTFGFSIDLRTAIKYKCISWISALRGLERSKRWDEFFDPQIARVKIEMYSALIRRGAEYERTAMKNRTFLREQVDRIEAFLGEKVGAVEDWYAPKDNNEARAIVEELIFGQVERVINLFGNVPIAGMNSVDMQQTIVNMMTKRPFAQRVYSATCMRTDYPYIWRGQFNEDAVLTLDCLTRQGELTATLFTVVARKPSTQVTVGGNTGDLYGEDLLTLAPKKIMDRKNERKYQLSTLAKTKFLCEMYPDFVVASEWKNRVHHTFLHKRIRVPLPRIRLDKNKK